MSDNQDPYADVYWTINDRVGKAVQREPAPLLICKRAEPRILDQKISHAFELFQKPCGYGAPRFDEGCSSNEFGANSCDHLRA